MKKFNRSINWTGCVATMILSISLNASAQSEEPGSKHRPLYDDESVLPVTIEGPLQTIMREREVREEYPAIFKYADADGTEVVLNIKLRMRGKYRAREDRCNFAPLRVNFKKSQVKGTLFAGQDKIKLVTDCQSAKSRFQQILLKEYLAYRILNLISDRSFNARLLRVTYVDTDRKIKSRESFAFFIEDEKHIGDRLGLMPVKIPKTKYAALDPAHANLINVYEYFIANTDFSLVRGAKGDDCCHNAVLYQDGDGPYISIPYDFDHAGLIDAPYASPNPRFKIRSVKRRLYRGRCSNNSYLDATFQQFLAKQEDIGQLITELEGINKRSIKSTMKLVGSFYKDINSPKKIEKKFVKKCWGEPG